MSLDRKDVRLKLTPEAHEQLVALADFNEKDISEFASYLLERALLGEAHSVNLLALRMERWGKSGNHRDLQGLTGKAVVRRVK